MIYFQLLQELFPNFAYILLKKNIYYLSARFQTLGNDFRTEENILEIIIFIGKLEYFYFI